MILSIKTKNGRMTINLIEFLYPKVSQKKVKLLIKTLMADPWENETAIRETCMFFRGDMDSLMEQQAGAKMRLTMEKVGSREYRSCMAEYNRCQKQYDFFAKCLKMMED